MSAVKPLKFITQKNSLKPEPRGSKQLCWYFIIHAKCQVLMLYVQNQGCGEIVQCDTGKSCQKALWFIGRQWEQDGCGRRGGALDNLTTPLETPGIKEQKKQPIKENLCRGDRQSLISYMGYNKAQKGQPWGAGTFCPRLSLLYRLPWKIHIPHLPGKSWEPLVKRLGFNFLVHIVILHLEKGNK